MFCFAYENKRRVLNTAEIKEKKSLDDKNFSTRKYITKQKRKIPHRLNDSKILLEVRFYWENNVFMNYNCSTINHNPI